MYLLSYIVVIGIILDLRYHVVLALLLLQQAVFVEHAIHILVAVSVIQRHCLAFVVAEHGRPVSFLLRAPSVLLLRAEIMDA